MNELDRTLIAISCWVVFIPTVILCLYLYSKYLDRKRKEFKDTTCNDCTFDCWTSPSCPSGICLKDKSHLSYEYFKCGRYHYNDDIEPSHLRTEICKAENYKDEDTNYSSRIEKLKLNAAKWNLDLNGERLT